MSAKRPPLEPLSRPAWERVEAGVFARLDRGEHLVPSVDDRRPRLRRQRSAWALAGAFAAAASVALWLGVGSEEGAAPSARPAVVEARAVPAHEARIVSTEAPTQTMLGESLVVLAAHSDVSVSGSDGAGWRVRLEAGQVDCQVAPRQGRPPFVVQAGATQVTVVGTRFSVTRSGEQARVAVTEGHVQVDSADSHVLLGPGESWPRSEPSVALPRAAEAGSPGDTRAALEATPRAPQRFDRAARLESKKPQAALAIYRDLARGKGPWAANALYAEARLELELGHQQRAERLLRLYLVRYPEGLNAADVRKLLEGAAPRAGAPPR
jgi:hypothetical protein